MNHDRIAELEQEIAEQEDLAARCLSEHRYVFDGRAQHLRAELSRLRNEQPPGWDSITHELGECPTISSPAPSSEPQDVRGLARDAADTISRELAELGVRVPDDLREPIASEIRKVIRTALAQSDAQPAASAGLIEAAEWLGTAASRFEEAADALRSEYKTYARQMDRWAGDTRERARLFRILSRAAERGVHGELIPDCPTDGVAARQGNGG